MFWRHSQLRCSLEHPFRKLLLALILVGPCNLSNPELYVADRFFGARDHLPWLTGLSITRHYVTCFKFGGVLSRLLAPCNDRNRAVRGNCEVLKGVSGRW